MLLPLSPLLVLLLGVVLLLAGWMPAAVEAGPSYRTGQSPASGPNR